MKNLSIAFAVGLLFFGCSGSIKTPEEEKAYFDSISVAKTGKTISERAKERTDSIIGNAMMDTSGLHKAPVKVIKAILFKKEYSSYRDIRLTYKNISKKTIAGIKFRWKGVNAFGEPADMGGSMTEGFGGGFTDDTMKPGRTETSEWGILSRDGKRVVLAWPIEVAFTDGSKWDIGK